MFNFLVGNDFLSAVVAFGLILIPAVIIHELGHFLAAKSVGIAVLEFGIGFPPRIMRLFRWGETEFTLNWLPIGGFVRPLGEDMIRPVSQEAVDRDREMLLKNSETLQPNENTSGLLPNRSDEPKEQLSKRLLSVSEAKPLPRIFFMAAGALANFISAFILFVVIGLIGVPQDVGGRVQVVEVPASSQFAAAGLQNGDLIEDLNGQKFQSSDEFFSRFSEMQGKPVTLTIRRFDPEKPTDLGTVFDIQLTPDASTVQTAKEGYVRVLNIMQNSPADLAGLLSGDAIVALNSETITNAENPTKELQSRTDKFAGEKITLTIMRKGQELEIGLVPRVKPPQGEGKIGVFIGAEFRSIASGLVYADGVHQQEMIPQSFISSVQYAYERTAEVFSLIAQIPSRIANQTLTAEEARPVSIVGISQLGGQALQQSIQEDRPSTILRYIAMINILLGITNLLPIPALDGGRILFVLVEIVRGRPIAPEREGMVHLIGLAFLLALGMIVILNDIINPITNIVR